MESKKTSNNLCVYLIHNTLTVGQEIMACFRFTGAYYSMVNVSL
jgi:hypothetical protein